MIWKEKKFYAKQDKSLICLPRQHLNIRPEALIFLCFRGLKPIFTNDLPKLSDWKMTLEEQNIMGAICGPRRPRLRFSTAALRDISGRLQQYSIWINGKG